jgi:hypothetical protein
VRRVRVSVAQLIDGGGCAFLQRDGSFGRPRTCRKPRYLRARGKARWRFSPAQPLEDGRYVVRARAVDARGVRSRVARRNMTVSQFPAG